ncbi:hypothetical protein RUND412_001588 [Rhizina undulata]
MQKNSDTARNPGGNGLDAYRDAREIIRLVQCSECSRTLRNPMTLPCGNAICRNCLPQFHTRRNISYPNRPERQEGFRCPFPDCMKEHSTADCAPDFTLTKVLEAAEEELERVCTEGEEAPLLESKRTVDPVSLGDDCDTSGRILRGGCLFSTFVMAKDGELPYDAEISFSSLNSSNSNPSLSDHKLLEILKEKLQAELECQVCYNLYLDPITTYCGHTFCRKCLERVLDHSRKCPSCRQELNLPSVLPAQSSNKKLTELLVGLFPDALVQRAMAVATEDTPGSSDGKLATPIFVCTTSYPGMPTPLHIFEPRYRLMIRRVLEDGSRCFGMVLPNSARLHQEGLGDCPFMQYGTLLYIEHVRQYPDGRSDLWTVGVSRFKIKSWGIRDEYVVADVEQVEDIPILEEEAIEAMETSLRISHTSDLQPPWMHLSTQALLEIGHNFIDQMQLIDPNFDRQSDLVYGNRPNDPALFPYWLASMLPIAEAEKYRLLSCTSVRGRLKIAVSWIKKIESHRWYARFSLRMSSTLR